MWQEKVGETFLKTLEHIEYGVFSVTTPEGKRHDFSGSKPGTHGHLIVNDWRAITSLAASGDIGFAEGYRDNLWDTDDLSKLLRVGLENEVALSKYIYGSFISRLVARIMYLFTRNTVKGSKRNIHAHYDLGNDFYSLWLDPSMTYSSALFDNQPHALEDAQYNKYDRILERLNSNSGTMLEIGCGWGGMADRALQNNDYNIKGITLSQEQHDYAKKRLQGNVDIALEDYRHQQGKYDHIVSIEMFEAVGEKFWPTYFEKVKTLLNHKGKAIIQTITIGEEYFDAYRKGGDMIRSFIFPGGMLPSPLRFNAEAEKAGLQLTDSYAFGKDYARTLAEWLHRFEEVLPEVRALGFDNKFIRIWRFYLAACNASFSVNRTDVMQMELQHA